MRYLLDTNTCIRYLNGVSEHVKRRVEMLSPEDIVVCSIVKAELFYGAQKSRYPEQNLARQRKFLDRFFSLSFDDQTAETYGRIRSQLERAGTPIGPNDLLIAATALTYDVTLVTHNTREFVRVSGLRYEDWEIASK